MKQLSKKWWFLNSLAILLSLLSPDIYSQQPANYINNGGFEECGTCGISSFPRPKFWGPTDSLKYFAAYAHNIFMPNSIPLNSYAYQWPRNGDAYIVCMLFCPNCPGEQRGYPRNRLKKSIVSGSTYCFEMYVNLSNQSTYAIDAIEVYFADSSIDTIKECNIPLTYLTPQISNPTGNYFSDTLGWTPFRGSFVATGSEKYLMIGNFKSNTNTNKIFVNGTNLPVIASDYLLDDVSLIDMNLAAFAGSDTAIVPGDSAFIGRTPDVGIDEACQWFKWPNMSTAIDTVAGLWVKPVTTSTYIVRQQLWCSGVKWDTVVIHMNPVSLHEKIKWLNEQLKIFPVPADDQIVLMLPDIVLAEDVRSLKIYDHFGQMIREREVRFESKTVTVDVALLKEGIYTVQLNGEKAGTVQKKFVIRR